MMDKTNIKAFSDDAIVALMGAYIKHHRLEQDKTQSELANKAGINRSTLVEFENGKRVNTITFVQLLRALNLLYIMEQFTVDLEISPMQLAKLDQLRRKRASKNKVTLKKKKSTW